MIQMRENRYEDIRNGIVNRSFEVTKPVKPNAFTNTTKATVAQPKHDVDPRANQADEYLDDEYNSWS